MSVSTYKLGSVNPAFMLLGNSTTLPSNFFNFCHLMGHFTKVQCRFCLSV